MSSGTFAGVTDPSGFPAAELDAVEGWFVRRGVPHFVERSESAWTIWSRALPLLVVYYLTVGFNALDVAHWSLAQNLGVAAIVVAVLVGTWVAANLLRDRAAFARPTSIGPAELAVFVVAPVVPSLLVRQWGDAFQSLASTALALVAIWLITSYGLLWLVRWAASRTLHQLAVFFNVIVRALPLLLVFTTFLFINAEVWQVAGRLDGIAYLLVLAIFFVLGSLFLLSRLPTLLRDLNRFDTWADVVALVDLPPARALADAYVTDTYVSDHPAPPNDRPTGRQRFNIALVALLPQAIQITLGALTMTAFFVVFGTLAIPLPTVASWTQFDPADVHTFLTLHLGGRELVVTEPLIRVAAFLGAFTGMYFTVVLSTDATYRGEFTDDIGPELRHTLAVRVVYRMALARHDGTAHE